MKLSPFLVPVVAALSISVASSQTLRIFTIDVDQGASTLIVSPTGRTMLVDGGANGYGNSAVRPLMQSLGLSQLDYMVASHYDTDHVGGLDEVANGGFRPTIAYDRGTFGGTPGSSSYSSYVNSIASRRRTITPGTLINLGGGVSARCYTVNGSIWQGPTINISGSSQFENSASVGLKIEYGSFDFWVGGDLTGGGNSTTDVESQAASRVGDLDAYTANHHGSNTSTNATWVNTTRPEVTLFSAGANNPFGHPTPTTINRLSSASRATLLIATTEGAGAKGFLSTDQNHIELETDGVTYSLSWTLGRTIRVLCDEQTGTAPVAGDVIISEAMVDPSQASDSDGEWFELTAMTTSDVHLGGMRVYGASEGLAFTLGVPLLLRRDQYLTFAIHGDPDENGGFDADFVWPFGRYALTNGNDLIEIRNASGATLDSLSYSSGWPWQTATSMERIDRNGMSTSGNFAAATTSYGQGDRGTPGVRNAADNTGGPSSFFDVTGTRIPGGTLIYGLNAPNEVGKIYMMESSVSTFPGFFFGATWVRLNLDPLFLILLGVPGMNGIVPPSGITSVTLPLPNDPSLSGFAFYSLGWTFEFDLNGIPRVTRISELVITTIS